MKIMLALIFIVAAQPAFACHRYSVWKYPFSQRCGVAAQLRHVRLVKAPPTPAAPDPRARAVEALKVELRALEMRALELHTIGFVQGGKP